MQIEVHGSLEPFGAVVSGWRPDQALAAPDLATIRAALREHLVLVFRGHPTPSDAQLVRFAHHFGDLVKGSEWFGDIVEFPEILPITNRVGDDGIAKGTGGAAEFPWHADYSYVPRPGKGELPRRGGASGTTRHEPASVVNTSRSKPCPRALAEPLREPEAPSIASPSTSPRTGPRSWPGCPRRGTGTRDSVSSDRTIPRRSIP